MSVPSDSTPRLEEYRQYLLLLAKLQVSSDERGGLDPSDLVQETMLSAHQGLEQFRGATSQEFMAWLRRILANKLIDALRRKGRGQPVALSALEADMDRSSTNLARCLLSEQSTPSVQLMRDDQLHRLAISLAALPEDQRQVVELRHLRGWSIPAISQELGKSVPSVAGLLRRGLEALREQMIGDGSGSAPVF